MLANGSNNLSLPRERALRTQRIDLVRPGFRLPKLTRGASDAGAAACGKDQSRPLLDVRGLTVGIGRNGYRLVDGISFNLKAGETLGIVGESGCGKSLTSLALMGLLPEGLSASGAILFGGVDLLTLAALRT